MNRSFSQQSHNQSLNSYSAIDPEDAKRIQLKRDRKISQLKKYGSLSFVDLDRSQSQKGRRFLKPKREMESFYKPRKVPGPKNLCVTKIAMENRYLRESRCSMTRDSQTRDRQEQQSYYPCNNIQINNCSRPLQTY